MVDENFQEVEIIEPDLTFDEDIQSSRVPRHHYSVEKILLAVKLLVECGCSLRGIDKILKLIESDNSERTPDFSCIRKWLGRIGLYELYRQKEYRDDWIFILDLTAELGKQKALVILGIPQKYYLEEVLPSQRGLTHQDMEILSIEIMDSTKGELIKEKLNNLSDNVGVPIQIVADHGSDLASGIHLYQQNHPSVIYTHDVTHAMALILKYQLATVEKYQSFTTECSQCRQQLQQTEFSFLSPPQQRKQCRFFNVEKLVDWAIKVLNISDDTLFELLPNTDSNLLQQKIEDKLGWLNDYVQELPRWSQMIEMTRTLETQLKLHGLNQQSLEIYQLNNFNYLDPELKEFQFLIFEYLEEFAPLVGDNTTLLATSDVIESIFGKYKKISARSPFKQLSQMLLTISLSTMDLTTAIVKKALETIRFEDVEAWSTAVFTQSMLSIRKILFSSVGSGTETA